MGAPFFYYHAGDLAVNVERPWQVCSAMGALCAKLSSEEKARRAVDALCKDKAAGALPCNLSQWDKAHLLTD